MTQGMRILVVDDTPTNLVLMEAMLKKMGHQVIKASSGEQALELFQQSHPDLVLMDVMMPGWDGYESVRQIRAVQSQWVPIIFVSAMTQVEDLVKGIQAGGDDYLFKPVNYEVLSVKIGMFNDRLGMSRTMSEQNRLLLDHRARIEDEHRVAQDLMYKLSALDQINDPDVRFYLQPAENFSGDLIAVGRTPANHLYLLLADSTGHGLTSALAVSPVLQPFQAMTAKGYSIAAIAAEINRKVREYLPISRFVTLALVAVDGDEKMISVWNGGCPPVLLLDVAGEVVHRFDSKHLPTGVLSADQFDDSLAHYRIEDEDRYQVLMCSDGALDILDQSSLSGAMQSLLRAAHTSGSATRFAAVKQLLEQHQVGAESPDDIALIMADCSVAQEAWQEDTESVVHSIPEGRTCSDPGWRISMTLTPVQLCRLDIVPFLLQMVTQLESGATESGKLFMVLSELINNALDHGLLQLDSRLKHDPVGMEQYYAERTGRLRALGTGEIRLALERNCNEEGMPCLRIRIKDSGDGFDHHYLTELDPASESRHGRGIPLINSICRSVTYLGNGSEVEVCLDL